jgi:hypothetical protein
MDKDKEALTPLDQLKSVLCDPEGKCCIAGSAEDRAVVDRALQALAQPPLPVQEPVAWVCYGAPGKRDIDFEEADINGLPIGTLLYTTPPAQPAPVQEPVAWMHEWADGERIPLMYASDSRGNDEPVSVRPLVFGDTAPPAAQPPLPAQEPDELTIAYMSGLYDGKKKRPWVGLTAQEAADCWTTSATKTWHNFEAALKEKNT